MNRENAKFRYYCPHCNEHVDDDLRKVRSLSQQYEKLLKDHASMSLSSTVEELRTAVESIQNNASPPLARETGTDAAREPDQDRFLMKVISELQDKDRRKTNIILVGLQESTDSDAAVRKQHVLKLVHDVMTVVAPGAPNDVKATYRLGKNESGATARLLKVVLQSEHQRNEFVSKAKKLRDLDDQHKIYKVFLNADRTPTQRALDKKRREEYKA